MAEKVTVRHQAEAIGTIDEVLADLREVRTWLPVSDPERCEHAARILGRLSAEIAEAADWLRGGAR